VVTFSFRFYPPEQDRQCTNVRIT